MLDDKVAGFPSLPTYIVIHNTIRDRNQWKKHVNNRITSTKERRLDG
jgi:hypothetical protein